MRVKEYENVPWGKYDGVVCVSIEHLVNDLDILSAVRAGTQVFLSCATFDDASHVRFFSGEQSVRTRFSPLLEIRRLERVADKIIVQGVRKPWRYSQDKLTGMFRANHYSYLQEQDELYRYVAGHLSGRVLDVGCWNGLLYPYLNCVDYVGIDLCKEAIEEARSRYAGEFHVSDWEAFPLLSG